MLLFRRVLLVKIKSGIPDASQIRPLDIYSVILRIMSSAYHKILRLWILDVTLPCQFAVRGGIVKALASLGGFAEQVLARRMQVWAIAIDFQKLYNTLAPTIAAQVAQHMGMSAELSNALVGPIVASKGFWRLPQNACTSVWENQRGVPQGMATSVMMAELCISVLLWKLRACAEVVCLTYVDDVNILAATRETLVSALHIPWDFVGDFNLKLSLLKTRIWGSDKKATKQLAEVWGVKTADSLQALGAEWPLRCSAERTFDKEKARIQEAVKRLKRLAHIHPSIVVKLDAINVGCLSLLNYVPLPSPAEVYAARKGVRQALGQMHGAPEILFCAVTRVSIDPFYHWLLAAVNMWKTIALMPGMKEMLDDMPTTRRYSRLSQLKKQVRSVGWEISGVSLDFSLYSWMRFSEVPRAKLSKSLPAPCRPKILQK